MVRLGLAVVVMLLGAGVPAASSAQNGRGLVIDVDPGRRVVVLEGQGRRVDLAIAPTARIDDQHGRPIAFADIRIGDAIAYRVEPDGRSVLSVASQFWAPADD